MDRAGVVNARFHFIQPVPGGAARCATSNNGDYSMKAKNVALGGAAIVALAGLISFLPTAGFAQSDAAQQQYQQQQQQYQQQQGQYQDQQNQYNAQKRQYDHDVRHYDNARWNYNDYPTAFSYRYDDSPRLRRLYLIAEPSQQLANAPVEGPNGVWVGRVRNVETDVDGRPSRVEIALNRRVSVWVSPGDLRFDADDKVVFTDLTREQLWQNPGATVEAGEAGASY
jgi:hypothetical protein